jgi:alkylation response protein AidB-like acyl-CoA dehydrogenase
MNRTFTVEQDEWRAEVREFLDEELPPEMARSTEFTEDEDYWDFALQFTTKVAQKGWIGLTWPKEYGGLARPTLDRLILAEEFTYSEAPLTNTIGWGLAAGAILFGGSEEQKRRFLPSIARNETFWVEGFTEPGAGSDLASLTTRADRDGDEWVISGQKTFTTWGSHGDVIFLAARTDQDVAKHRGISIFCVDMNAPGVSVAPLYNLGGGRQNNTFFDHVRVAGDMLIGEEGRGWDLIMNAFYGASGVAAPYAGYQKRLEELVAHCQTARRNGRLLIDDPMVRDRLAELALIVEAERLLTYESLSNRAAGRRPAFAGALGTVVAKEAMPRFAEIYNEVLGTLGQLSRGSRWAPLDGWPEAWYRQSFRNHAGGTPQVKRMVLATRGLELPR